MNKSMSGKALAAGKFVMWWNLPAASALPLTDAVYDLTEIDTEMSSESSSSYASSTANMFATLSRESQSNLSDRWFPCVKFPISQKPSDLLSCTLRIAEERAREEGK